MVFRRDLGFLGRVRPSGVGGRPEVLVDHAAPGRPVGHLRGLDAGRPTGVLGDVPRVLDHHGHSRQHGGAGDPEGGLLHHGPGVELRALQHGGAATATARVPAR